MNLFYNKQSKISFSLEILGTIETSVEVRVVLGSSQKLILATECLDDMYFVSIPPIKDYTWLISSGSVPLSIEIIASEYYFAPLKKTLKVDYSDLVYNKIEKETIVQPKIKEQIGAPVVKTPTVAPIEVEESVPATNDIIAEPAIQNKVEIKAQIPEETQQEIVPEVIPEPPVELTAEQKLLEEMRKQKRIRKAKSAEKKRVNMKKLHPEASDEEIEKIIAEAAAIELRDALSKQNEQLRNKLNAKVAAEEEVAVAEALDVQNNIAKDHINEIEIIASKQQKQQELLASLRKNKTS